MVEGLPGVSPKPRFGLILDSTADASGAETSAEVLNRYSRIPVAQP